jgi:hypothetical protein
MIFFLSWKRHRPSRAILAFALLPALLFAAKTAPAVNGEMNDGRYTDELGVCSFTPPEKWVLWDYYGLDVFSPAENRDIRLSLVTEASACDAPSSEASDGGTTTDPNDFSSPFLKREVKGFENTFSEPDFELISLEQREFSGHPGVDVCARATAENRLFPDTIIHIVRYYTPTHVVTMTLRCPPEALDECRDIFESAVESISLDPLPVGGQSLP